MSRCSVSARWSPSCSTWPFWHYRSSPPSPPAVLPTTPGPALGAMAVGFVAGAAALGMGQAIPVITRSTLVRLAVALAFTAPAAFAGYHLVLGLSHIGGAHGVWQQIFAVVGAIAIGAVALARLATPIIPPAPPTRTA